MHGFGLLVGKRALLASLATVGALAFFLPISAARAQTTPSSPAEMKTGVSHLVRLSQTPRRHSNRSWSLR